jgi:hypothetical protein
MMHADAAVDLVVEADLPVRHVPVSGKLHAVHAEIGMPPARPKGVFGVDLRQRDESAAVARPGNELRQAADRGFVSQHRGARRELGPQVPEGARHVAIAPGVFPEGGLIDLELHQAADGLEHVAEKEARPFQGAAQVADHREGRTLDPLVEQGRSARLVDSPVDGRRLEIGIDLLVQPDQLPCSFQVDHARA